MPPTTKPEPAAPDPEPIPEGLVFDPYSFTAPERLEVQVQFDTAYGDLLDYVRESWNPNRTGPMENGIIDRNGRRWWPDEILQFMLWVQVKRDRPDVELAEFDGLALMDLNLAHVRGLSGKAARTSGRPERSSSGPDSSASTAAG